MCAVAATVNTATGTAPEAGASCESWTWMNCAAAFELYALKPNRRPGPLLTRRAFSYAFECVLSGSPVAISSAVIPRNQRVSSSASTTLLTSDHDRRERQGGHRGGGRAGRDLHGEHVGGDSRCCVGAVHIVHVQVRRRLGQGTRRGHDRP